MAKKYFWLKLKDDFFQDKRIKKLRRVAGGDTYTVIYLKMQLLSLKNEGILKFEGVENTFYEEIALEIDEDEENVQFTLMFLEKNGLIEEIQDNEFALIETMSSIGTESQSAERVRRHRELKKEQKALQCNTDVTTSNTEIEIEIEKEIEKEIDKEKDIKTLPQQVEGPSNNQLEEQFDQWYSFYPKKVNKKKAFDKFKLKVKKHGFEKVFEGMASYAKVMELNGTEKQYIKGPDVFLNGEHYLDDHSELIKQKPAKQQTYKPWEELAYGTTSNSSTYDDYSQQLPKPTKQIGW